MSKGLHTRVPRLILPTLVAAALALLAAFAAAQPASTPGGDNAPQVVPAERFDVSPPLSEMAAGEEHREAAPVFREIPRQPLPRRGPKAPGPDPALQDFHGPAVGPAPKQNFDGVGNVDAVLPPDTNGAVGKTQYVQWVNLSFAVYDKATGAKTLGPVKGNTLWQGFGGPCETTNDGDPIVLYDHLANRWFMSQFALPNYPSGPFYQCIAVSQTDDATGSFYRYAFKVSDTKLNDYPKFGRREEGYYMAVNQFVCSFFGCSWAGQGVAVFERAKMLLGESARMIFVDLYSVDPNLGGMLPADLDGPDPGGAEPFVQFDDNAWGYSGDQLQVWAFAVNWINGTGSFDFVVALPTTAFDSNLCGYSANCLPQRGTKRKVDAISDRLMYRLQYRTFTDHAAMVVNHSVDVDGTDHAGIRWYELRNGGSGWGIHQQGTYAPDANSRWMGSMAMDKDGNIALGYSVSGANLYPAIRYTGRLATDTPTDGTMTLLETSIIDGGGSQTHSSGRWGDYSAMAVDPVDGCTFWYTTEYYSATSSAGWKTRVGSFKFDSCGAASPAPPSADVSVTQVDSPDPVLVGSNVTYTLTVANAGPDGATNVVVTDTPPAGATFSATPSQGTCSGTGPVTCSIGSLASGASATVSVVVTATAAGTITNSATVGATEADPNAGNNSTSESTTVNSPPPPSSAPVVSACNPSIGNRNQQIVVAVTGSNFQGGATVSFGQRVMVQGVTFVSATQLNVQIKVHPQAASGPRDVTVTNPDGQSGSLPGCFTVN